MKNVPIREIASHLGVVCESETQVLGFQIDSRLVQEGGLFFALKGEKTDGHRHLAEARERGAVAAIVSKGYSGSDFGLVLLPVEDVEGSLQELARYFIQKNPAQRIGVTGSVGKTTTKDFIATLLSAKYKVGKTHASYNTKLTFPLSLLNLEGDEEVLVLEMGMSEPGDLKRLLSFAPPDVAVLTKVALAHAQSFPGGIEQIAHEKAEIFSDPRTKTAVFFQGLCEYPEIVQAIKADKVSFSLEERAADYFLSLSEDRYFVDERGVRAYQFDLPFRQSHILHNFLAAVSVARIMKMEWDEINRQVGKLELPKMRFEQFTKEGISFVNDAYNANPESMRAALSNLPNPQEGGKRIAVLGAMKELGSFSEESHRDVGRFAQKFADHLLVLGEEAAPLCEGFGEVKKPAEHFSDLQTLAERLKALMSPGDIVLVKGSRSMGMEKLFDRLYGGN